MRIKVATVDITVLSENSIWIASLFVEKRAHGDVQPEYVMCTALSIATHINTCIMAQSSRLVD